MLFFVEERRGCATLLFAAGDLEFTHDLEIGCVFKEKTEPGQHDRVVSDERDSYWSRRDRICCCWGGFMHRRSHR